MPDILPREWKFYNLVEKTAFKIASYYGYEEIQVPIVESSELFEKGTGLSTDIVQKQMYAVQAQGGDKMTLRPELTPSIVRAYIQHGMISWTQPVKLSSIGSVFRHERPQAGRFREFRQFELDAIGERGAILDVQIIFLFFEILRALGIKNLSIQVNSIGCSRCMPNYKKSLRDYYRGRERSLCKDCRKRKKINIMRVLDCKDEKCERLKISAPQTVDHLCQECNGHLKNVLESLDYLELPFVLSPRLVRGLDYYTKTVFEIFPIALGESSAKDSSGKNINEMAEEKKNGGEERVVALAGGGRFDDLVKLLGGEETPAVGGSMGMERVVARLKSMQIKIPKSKNPRVFFVHLGELAKKKGLKIIEEFRSSGILVKESLGRSSIKSQMSIADKLGVDYVLILGHQEFSEGTIIIRDMDSGKQERVPVEKIVGEIKKRLRKK